MLWRNLALFILSAGLIFTVASARAANPAAQKKEYLTDSEADKIREAVDARGTHQAIHIFCGRPPEEISIRAYPADSRPPPRGNAE